MAMLQTLHLSHLPPSLAVHVALYRDLQNASFLRQQLLDGNSDFEYAFIDANVVRNNLIPPRSSAIQDSLGRVPAALMFADSLNHTHPSSSVSSRQ